MSNKRDMFVVRVEEHGVVTMMINPVLTMGRTGWRVEYNSVDGGIEGGDCSHYVAEQIIEAIRRDRLTLKVVEGARLERATEGSAGYDLRAAHRGIVEPSEVLTVGTGVHVAIPEGYVGMVCSRSGLAAKHGVHVLNAPGIIDSDYRGEVKVLLRNTGRDAYFIEEGDRIAQLVIVPCITPEVEYVESLPATARGAGGLGSTGSA